MRFYNLEITGGIADEGGGILNAGDLLLESTVVRENKANLYGGGIANFGSLELKDGCELWENRALQDGGGIYTESAGGGVLTATDTVLRQNKAYNDGGGIFSIGAVVTLRDTVLDRNDALRMGGGAYVRDSPVALGALDVQAGTEFTGNKAGVNGGGLWFSTQITNVEGADFVGNEAGLGGGIQAEAIISSLLVTVRSTRFDANSAFSGGGMNSLRRTYFEDVTFSDNHASSAGGGLRAVGEMHRLVRAEFIKNVGQTGGAIYATGNLRLEDSVVHHNRVSGAGGGIFIWGRSLFMSDSTVAYNQIGPSESPSLLSGVGGGVASFMGEISATRVSIWGNTARTYGGGIYMDDPGRDTLVLLDLENSTVAFNEAEEAAGGGILIDSARAGAIIQSSTITGNTSALEGAGVVFLGVSLNLNLLSSIVADNTISSSGAGSDCRGMVQSMGSNLVRNYSSTCTYTPYFFMGDLMPGTPPGFGTVADPTTAGPGRAVVRLGSGSPAINSSANCPSRDQLQYFRVGGCDMGAVEYLGEYQEAPLFEGVDFCDDDSKCGETKEDPPTPRAGPRCGLGFEFALVLPVLMALRRRGRGSFRALSALLGTSLAFGFFAAVPSSQADTFSGGPDYAGQNLAGQNFSGADLFGADFSGANLAGTSFFGANLTAVDFRNANLTGTNFRLANLTGADLSGSIRAGANWDQTTCPDGVTQAWNPETCGPPPAVGPAASLPSEYPPTAGAIGWVPAEVAPADIFAVWDVCPRVITPADIYPYTAACMKAHTDAGFHYLTYHPLSWVELGPSGSASVYALYPELETDGFWMDFDGYTNPRGESDPVPTFSNASSAWLRFMVGTIKNQIDAGATGIAFDEGWGSLGPGQPNDFSPMAMEAFRVYLEARYSDGELAAKGIEEIATFNWIETILETPVLVLTGLDPGAALSPEWWESQLGRLLAEGETYTRETFELASQYGGNYEPLMELLNAERGDYAYYNRTRLRVIYETIQDQVGPYAAAKEQQWHLSANVYNSLGWGNAAVGAVAVDLPMGELSYREGMWPERNYAAFYKNMAALGKRFSAMFWPGQVLHPADDSDTEALVMFLADAYASGGVAQHPGFQYNALVNPFFELIQAHEEFFTETDNRVALYYSLGNHMGDVGRPGEEVWTYYGAARLLEDSHYSYDVLYQGDPDMGPGTTRWVDQVVAVEEMQAYTAIVLPHTTHMADAEVTSFLAYVEAGGVLIALGEAGTQDFDFPVSMERNDPIWESLVSVAGIHTHGAGKTIVFPEDGYGINIGNAYDNSQSSADLSAFQGLVASVLESDIDTSFGKDVHVHKFRDPESQSEFFHLVNFDYDRETDTVAAKSAQNFDFLPTGDFDNPRVVYFTPENPSGVELEVTQHASGRLGVLIPDLHLYGVVRVPEPSAASLSWAALLVLAVLGAHRRMN